MPTFSLGDTVQLNSAPTHYMTAVEIVSSGDHQGWLALINQILHEQGSKAHR